LVDRKKPLSDFETFLLADIIAERDLRWERVAFASMKIFNRPLLVIDTLSIRWSEQQGGFGISLLLRLEEQPRE